MINLLHIISKVYLILTSLRPLDGSALASKTRAGNPKFSKWYATTIMTSFVQNCRDILPEDQRGQSFYMVADGEQLQLQPYDDEEIMTMLEEYHIELGKGLASCTNTFGNACDRSRLFKAAKKSLKSEKSVSVSGKNHQEYSTLGTPTLNTQYK
jgi:hypothetical protein